MSLADDETAPHEPLIGHHAHRAHPDETAVVVPVRSSANAFTWALTVAACVSGLLFGYDTGVISSTLVSIHTDLSDRALTNLDKGLITSSTSLFALIASPAAGLVSDRVGRKNVILLADVLFTLGALAQALTHTVWAMIAGRSVVGLAIGGASLIVPLYIAELAPSHLRGRLVTVSLMFITGGQVIAYLVGWALSTRSGGWRWMVGLGAVPAVAQLVMLAFLPETPRFLVKARRESEARRVLAKVYRGMAANVDRTVDDVVAAIKREMREEEEADVQLKRSVGATALVPPILQSLLGHPPHWRALVITCTLQGLQQLCGFNSLMYFSATIFQRLRFSSPTLTSLSVAGANFAFTLVAFQLIDRIGRRRMLLLTVPVMAAALLLCAGAFGWVPSSSSSSSSSSRRGPTDVSDGPSDPGSARGPAVAILLAMLLYVATYALGLGNVPWLQSELFPLSVRSVGSGIATATNWGCNTLVGLTFLPMMDLLTPTGTFVCYAVICLAGWAVIRRIYPETMGLGLEAVAELLKDGWGVQKSLSRLATSRS